MGQSCKQRLAIFITIMKSVKINYTLYITLLTANAISMDISTIRGHFFHYPWTVLFRDPKESKMLYPWTPSSRLALSKDMLSMDIAKQNFHIIVQLGQTLINST